MDDESLVLQFRAEGSAELLGVRLANDPLPVPGIACLDDQIQTPRDWYLDRRIALGEALDAGLLGRALRQPHPGWTEFVVDSKEWTSEPQPPRRSLTAVIRARLSRGHRDSE